MSLAATLGSRFALLVGGRVTMLVLSLLATAMLTRFLGTDGFGHFRAAVAYLALAISLADLGLASLFVREISRPGADQSRLIANALGLRLAIAGLALLIALVLAFFLPFEPADRLGIVGGALGFLAYSVHLMLFGLFQQKLRQEGVVLAEVSGGLVLVLAILVFAWAGAEPWWFAAAMGGSYVFTLGISLLAARRLVGFGVRAEGAVWARLIRQGAPLAVATSVTVLYFRGDTVLLAILQPPSEVGLYGVPVKVLDAFMGITLLFVGLFAPLMASTAKVDAAGFLRHLESGLGTLALGTVAVGLGIVALAPELIGLLAGADFVVAAPILQLLAGVLVLHGTALIMREAATAMAIQHKLLPAYFAGLAVAFAGYFTLIPRFGGPGAALALLLAEAVVVALVATILVRAVATAAVLRVPALALAAGLAAAAASLWLEWQGYNFFTRGAAAAALYAILVLATGAVSLPALCTLGREMLARRGV